MAASLKEFGWKQPIVVDGGMVVIAGHTRLEAARSLGYAEVPVVIARDLDPAKVKAYRIADNRVADDAQWDAELLSLELTDLKELAYDLPLLGFSDGELKKYSVDTAALGREGEEEIPNVGEPETQKGDLIMLGRHRLVCGDARLTADILLALEGTEPDLLFFDPPYENENLWDIDVPMTSKALVFSGFWCIREAMFRLEPYRYVYEFVWDHMQSHYRPHMPLARHKTAFYCANKPGWNFDRALYKSVCSVHSMLVVLMAAAPVRVAARIARSPQA